MINENIKDTRGTLYIVATPIGNLEDITFRAVKILKEVDLIAAENVSHSKVLCRHYGIDTRLTAYNQHNSRKKGPALLRIIRKGSDVALISSAGTPAISDPGSFLIKLAKDEGIRISPIPGPSAVITALSVAGLRTDEFTFLGFLSNKAGARKKELKNLSSETRTMVFYESPHRIRAMLEDVKEVLGDRKMVVSREMTKIFEEILRGSAGSILDELNEQSIRGEFTVIIEGNQGQEDNVFSDPDLKIHIKNLLEEGRLSAKEISMILSQVTGIPYRKVYRESIKISESI